MTAFITIDMHDHEAGCESEENVGESKSHLNSGETLECRIYPMRKYYRRSYEYMRITSCYNLSV